MLASVRSPLHVESPHGSSRGMATGGSNGGDADQANGSKGNDKVCLSKLMAVLASLVLAVQCVGIWLVMFLRLVIFSLLLLPPFLRVGLKHFCDRRVHRGVRFAPGSRSFCDVYVPEEATAAVEGRGAPVPVVIAVMGGAWVIGHRTWNAQLGQRLMDAGVLVFAIDYRNYPFAKVPDMVSDLDRGVSWVVANAAAYGGNPDNIVITGQSAGAHLTSLLLLQRALQEQAGDLEAGCASSTEGQTASSDVSSCSESDSEEFGGSSRTWSLRQVRGYVGVSGPYDLTVLGAHLEARGLGSVLLRKMCPNGNLERFSPSLWLRQPEFGSGAAKLLPPMLLFHGAKDKSVPSNSSVSFARALCDAGAPSAVADVRPALAHAEVIIEGPMRGEDHQIQLLLPFLLGENGCKDRLQALPALQPMFPSCIIALASWVMPF